MFSKLRLNVIFLIFAIFLSLIFRELFILQIINNDENTQDIISQNFETFYIPAPRGEILDLNGNKLAESILEPYLFLNQKKINEENITIYKQFISFNFNGAINRLVIFLLHISSKKSILKLMLDLNKIS